MTNAENKPRAEADRPVLGFDEALVQKVGDALKRYERSLHCEEEYRYPDAARAVLAALSAPSEAIVRS